jgi:hypothetical protein
MTLSAVFMRVHVLENNRVLNSEKKGFRLISMNNKMTAQNAKILDCRYIKLNYLVATHPIAS